VRECRFHESLNGDTSLGLASDGTASCASSRWTGCRRWPVSRRCSGGSGS